ncbi:MAG: deoxyguanosinetriphosphate triphosphohydrolase [Thermodesulfovibrionales bacterium]|nr:deoxyguanosinetriphosphate triphosphohydrolase [Thermodesulfovibrionales bacterium]
MKNKNKTIRQITEEIENQILHEKASKSSSSLGRAKKEKDCDIRTCYQRDRDRIIHSKSFRRLKHKTQVFFAPKGDHFRTRLTHVLEVSQIARTISRALRLNEDLTEAIALGHDLGHTPFGHAGEAVLRELNPNGFSHYKQSLRVVDVLEKNGKGLNLTEEVKDGILKHSKGKGSIINKSNMPITLEGSVVRISDIIAYVNHDLDDALRAKIIIESDIPSNIRDVIGKTYSGRIDVMVKDVINTTIENEYLIITASEKMLQTINDLRDFLYKKVYESKSIIDEFKKAKEILRRLYQYYMESNEFITDNQIDKRHTLVTDFIASMTDRFALSEYEKIFMPNSLGAF